MSPRPTDWIGVDLDRTLARRVSGDSIDRVGEPVPAMLDRVVRWLADGRNLRILTARVNPRLHPLDWQDQQLIVERWCVQHVGRLLPVTCMKDHHMVELWDDLAVRVEENTGRRLSPAEHDPAPFASLVAVYVSREELQAVRALLLTPKLAWTSEGRTVPYGEVHERVGALLGRVASAEAVPQCSRCGRPESPTCCG